METEKKIIGRCPLCGGNVVKTCKGYRCEHNIGDSPSCVLNINAIIGNRKMADAEVAVLLEKRRILLDGVGSRAFNCSNYANQNAPCSFAIWRNIGGHQLTLEEAKEICEKGITSSELEMYREDGSIYRKRLGVSPDKLQIVKI